MNISTLLLAGFPFLFFLLASSGLYSPKPFTLVLSGATPVVIITLATEIAL